MFQSIKYAIIKKIEKNPSIQKALKKGKILNEIKKFIIKNLKLKNEDFDKNFDVGIDLQRRVVLIYVKNYYYFYPLFELRNSLKEKINKSFKEGFIRNVSVLRMIKKFIS